MHSRRAFIAPVKPFGRINVRVPLAILRIPAVRRDGAGHHVRGAANLDAPSHDPHTRSQVCVQQILTHQSRRQLRLVANLHHACTAPVAVGGNANGDTLAAKERTHGAQGSQGDHASQISNWLAASRQRLPQACFRHLVFDEVIPDNPPDHQCINGHFVNTRSRRNGKRRTAPKSRYSITLCYVQALCSLHIQIVR